MSKRAISFKAAIVIVILLHGLAFFAFVQIGSMRAKLARIDWKERLEKRSTEQNWPTANKAEKIITPPKAQKIAAQPVTPKLPPVKKPDKDEKRIATSATPSPKATPNNVIYSSTTEYKNGRAVSYNVESRRVVNSSNYITIQQPRQTRSIQIIPVY